MTSPAPRQAEPRRTKTAAPPAQHQPDASPGHEAPATKAELLIHASRAYNGEGWKVTSQRGGGPVKEITVTRDSRIGRAMEALAQATERG